MAIEKASTLENKYIQAFQNSISLLAQQKMSRVWAKFPKQSLRAEGQFYDRLAQTEVLEKLGTNVDTPIVKQIHDRRRAIMRDFHIGDLIDSEDVIRTNYDPSSDYVRNFAAAFARRYDRLALEALTGPAAIGKDGLKSVAFDTKNRVFQGSGSTAGPLDISAILASKEVLDENEADNPDEKRYFVVNARGMRQLLNTTEIKDADFNTVKALAMGQINTFAGFEFIRTELMTNPESVTASGRTYATTDLRCIFCTADALKRVIGNEMTTTIKERSDKCDSKQVYCKSTVGAVRTEEVKVGEVYAARGA